MGLIVEKDILPNKEELYDKYKELLNSKILEKQIYMQITKKVTFNNSDGIKEYDVFLNVYNIYQLT